MKIFSTVALAVSLALNVAVVCLFLAGDRMTKTVTPAGSGAIAEESTAASSPIDAEAWHDLQSDDLTTLVSRLRASGFPPAIIRAILTAQLDEEFAARRKALTPSSDSLPFWKTQSRDPKLLVALRQLEREQEQRFRALLGPDADSDDPYTRATENRAFGFLSREKADQVRQVQRNTAAQRMDLSAGGLSMAADRNAWLALEKEAHNTIAQILTPQELLEYDLRSSRTAESVRDALSAFNPTEAEFRAIHSLQAPFDDQFGQDFGLTLSAEQRRQRDEAQKQLTEQIKAGLAPDRAAEYERATDYNYRRTSQVVARLELPPETTSALWDVQKEFEKRRTEVYRSVPDANKRLSQLAALQEEAVARISPLLRDPRGVEAYKQYGGTWIASLVPQNPRPMQPSR